jgi:nicotinate-nucleotide pyrophosphorylase (carboxylating)
MTDTLICPNAFISPLVIEDAITSALAEDLGRAGDVTSIATVPENAVARAEVVARKGGIVCGLPLAAAAFRKLDPDVQIAGNARDGNAVQAKASLMTVSGNARAILGAERVALNFLGHLSGIATATGQFVSQIAHTRARVCCTRKTTPGLRALQKYAVRSGGAFNHRFGLDDAILIKDNHIAVAGGIKAVLTRAREFAGHLVKIEIEVDTLDQLTEVLNTGLADVALLDNMDPPMLKKAVTLTAGRLVLEASGGITLATAAAVAETGVDYLSSGAITHSSTNLDIGLDIDIEV